MLIIFTHLGSESLVMNLIYNEHVNDVRTKLTMNVKDSGMISGTGTVGRDARVVAAMSGSCRADRQE
jgi:hypothetical protein